MYGRDFTGQAQGLPLRSSGRGCGSVQADTARARALGVTLGSGAALRESNPASMAGPVL